MDIQDTLNDFNARIEKFRELKSSIVSDLKQDLPGFIEKVLRASEFPFVYMTGYTPGFNDGDPCTFNLHLDLGYGFSEHADHFDFDGADFSNLEVLTYEYMQANKIDKARALQVQSIFNGLEEILEDALEGNFQIAAAIDATGAFHCNIDTDYDCGY